MEKPVVQGGRTLLEVNQILDTQVFNESKHLVIARADLVDAMTVI